MYNELFSHKKKRSFDTCHSMDEPSRHEAKGNSQDAK